MQTDNFAAAEIEIEDSIVVEGEVFCVYNIEDNGDLIHLSTKGDDGIEHFDFAPFDVVHVVTSFEDEEPPDSL